MAAKESWRQARSALESFLKEQPENHILLGDLALTDMSLGDKAAALTLSEWGMTVNPIEKNAVLGIAMVKYLAMIATWAGEKDLACEQLAIAIRSPGDGQLKLMPFWDPLRGDPWFERIVALLAPKS